MITFNQETRRFSVVEFQEEYSAGGIGAVGLSGYTAIKRKKYVDQAIAEGKDPNQARKEAKQIYGGIVKNAAKGYLVGKGAEYLDKQLGVSKYIKNTNTAKKINKLMKKI